MLILLSALLACTSGNDLGANTTAHIDALRTLVEEHADAVSALNSTSEIAAIEVDYDVSYESEHMDEMGSAHDAHGDSMASCADMSGCTDLEAEHMDAMMEHLDGMETDMGSWDDEMSCSDDEDGGMSM